MKTKKNILISIALILLVAVLICSLTACLKIGMKSENVIKRLEEHGATVKSNLRSAPVISGWKSSSDAVITNIISAEYIPELNEGEGEEVSADSETQILYVIYCDDKKSADWVEAQCKAYMADEEHAEECAHWNVYRYDNTVMIGHYRLLAVARQY